MTKSRRHLLCWKLSTALLIIAGAGGIWPVFASPAQAASIAVCNGEQLRINASGTPIATLLDNLQKECDIRITGLPVDSDHPIFFSQSGTRQDILRNILQILDVKSYALEYRNDLLTQVTVLPVAPLQVGKRSLTTEAEPGTDAPPFVDGLRIIDVIAGSQADLMNLREGDLVLFYDGHRVTRPEELVRLTRERSAEEAVELLVIRDQTPLRIYLNGGFIGIRIRSGLIERRVLEPYLNLMK